MCRGSPLHGAARAHDDGEEIPTEPPLSRSWMCGGAPLHEAACAHDGASAACDGEEGIPMVPMVPRPRMATPRSHEGPEGCRTHTPDWHSVCAGSLKSASISGTIDIMHNVGTLPADDGLIAQRAAAFDARRVRLHIYDVKEGLIQSMNRLLVHTGTPVVLGGAFHVGVQVYGVEWAFGFTGDVSTGVWACEPQLNPQHCFRETLELGETRLSSFAFARLVLDLQKRYPGQSYDLLHNNCCNFAEDFCQRLGVAPLPMWVNRFARIGASMDSIVHFRRAPRRSSSAAADREPRREGPPV